MGHLAFQLFAFQILVTSPEDLSRLLNITFYILLSFLILSLFVPVIPHNLDWVSLEHRIRYPHFNVSRNRDKPLVQSPRTFPFALVNFKVNVRLPKGLWHR